MVNSTFERLGSSIARPSKHTIGPNECYGRRYNRPQKLRRRSGAPADLLSDPLGGVGIGSRLEADETLVVPDEDLTLVEGAIQPWSQGKAHSDYWNRLMAGLGEEMGFDLVTPWKDLPKAVRKALLEDYGIEIGAGVGEFATSVWRIGCMGHTARKRNVTMLLGALAEVLNV